MVKIILVFDTYRDHSLKSASRDKRKQGRVPTQYQVIDDINIKHIPMNRFLSHNKTKADLTDYLAAKTLEYTSIAHKRVITSSSRHTSIVLYCIVFIHFYSASHSLSLSEALPTTAIDTVSEFTR